MKNITDNIIKKIKDGELNMKPRWHFVLKAALFILGIAIVSLVAVYLLSFVIFALRSTGLSTVPFFGIRGLVLLVVSSPWILIATLGLFLVVLYTLVNHYSFSYKQPLVYSMVGVVLFVIAGASLIGQLSMHERINSFVQQHEVPGLSPLYRDAFELRPDEVTIGTIKELVEDNFTMLSDSGEEVFVIVTDDTNLPLKVRLEEGIDVLVFGDKDNSEITAIGIRPAPPAHQPPTGRGYSKTRPPRSQVQGVMRY